MRSDEIILDSFAGGGGASTGIELALDRSPDIAINHEREAIAMHAANHPLTEHHCESVWDIDPVVATRGRPVGLAWFSPDCKHFSKAKGGKPREKRIRGLAWVVLRWVNAVRPRVILLENVEEFQTWGPLGADGHAQRSHRGWYFRCFVGALQRRGYAVEWRELRACDYGAPTIRKRLFLIARCDGRPITWPEPTHGAPSSEGVRGGRLLAWRTAAECIDWTLPCPSIFERKKSLADATCRRVAKGIMRHVVNDPEPFIVPLTHQQESARSYSMAAPLPTVTGAHRGEMALVAPVLTEHANASGQRVFSADEPLRTQCSEVKGGHFALVSAFIAKHYGGVVGQDVRTSLGTVTATDHNSLVTAHVTKFNTGSVGSDCRSPLHTVVAGSCKPETNPAGATTLGVVVSHLSKLRGAPESHAPGQDERDPLHTISAQGNHFAEVRAFLVKYYGADQNPKLGDPLHTVTSRDRFGLVTVQGATYAIADIGLRMLAPRELFRAQGFPESYIIGDDPTQGLALTKTAQVRMCGNSVCPPLAAALVAANVPELARKEAAE
ncbi:DNA cytosine methyltransferase [Horticoccus sp. 23ND18S-11]|uniref:DNA cytosine methyltransferase n=1 Tax=Horticoccus sp. 23ND18S-11 TaxID=3391832 RepID=UPI0039C8EE95